MKTTLPVVVCFVIIALFTGAGWFYVTQYQPLTIAVVALTDKNQTLTAENTDAKEQVASLNDQVKDLTTAKSEDTFKISQLTSQLHSLQSEASASAVANNAPKEFVPPDSLPAQANWTWNVDGREYHNVVITEVEADVVHISYDGGMGAVNTADLTPDLQKRLNYDPQAAALLRQQKEAAQAKSDADVQRSLSAQVAQNAGSLKVEQRKLAQLKSAMDSAHYALLRATTHTNQYGVTVYNSNANDKDGGNERQASIEVLTTNYDTAQNAYNAELQVVTDLQK